MKLDAFIRAHVHMYEFHDRVPTGTICDNLKTGVVSHPKEGGLNNTLAIIKALSYRAPPVRVKPASRVH